MLRCLPLRVGYELGPVWEPPAAPAVDHRAVQDKTPPLLLLCRPQEPPLSRDTRPQQRVVWQPAVDHAAAGRDSEGNVPAGGARPLRQQHLGAACLQPLSHSNTDESQSEQEQCC